MRTVLIALAVCIGLATRAQADPIGTGVGAGTMSMTMGGGGGGTTTTITTSGNPSPGTWTYDPPPGLEGPIAAIVIFTNVMSMDEAYTGGGFFSQGGFSGSIEFMGAPDTPFAGKNLLTATFSDATLSGPETDGSTVHLTAQTGGIDPVDFTSDFATNFQGNRDMDFAFMNVLFDPMHGPPDFTSPLFSSTFNSDSFDFVTPVPEPGTTTLVAVGLLFAAGRRLTRQRPS